ncbi:hypothetical protein D3C72_2156210 [compost metagenome]
MASGVDMRLIGHPIGKIRLGDEAQRLAVGVRQPGSYGLFVERRAQIGGGKRGGGERNPGRGEWPEPRPRPVDARQVAYCAFQRKVSPARSGTKVVSPYGSSAGNSQSSRESVSVPVLRGRP